MKYMDGTPFLAKYESVKPSYTQASVGIHEQGDAPPVENPDLPPNAGTSGVCLLALPR